MRVLLIAHGFPPQGQGGAEIYAEACARRLSALGDSVFVLAREAVHDAPEYRVRDETRGAIHIRWLNNTYRQVRRFAEVYDNPAIQALAGEYIADVRPDVAHVHHLTGLSTRVLDELAARRIPVVLTLHDYWLLCHRGQLFDRRLMRCQGPAPDGCAHCIGAEAAASPAAFVGARVLRRMERVLPAGLTQIARATARGVGTSLADETAAREASRVRLAHMRDRWPAVTVALAPSRHVRDRFVAAGFPRGVIRISEYGVEPCRVDAALRPAGAPLRAGYLGTLMVSKAPHVLFDAVEMAPAGTVEIHVFGAAAGYHGDDSYIQQLDARRSAPSIHFHGAVARSGLAQAFSLIDVLVFPSVWDETSGIGAREALAAGIPVVASRLGGIPEYVRDGVNGLLFEPGRADQLAGLLQRLANEPGLLPRLRAGITSLRTLEEDVRATRAIYSAVQVSGGAHTISSRPRAGALRVAAVVLNYRTPDETLLAVQMLRMAAPPLDSIIVVDNDSGEACRRTLTPVLPEITLLSAGRNLGFSGGCNVGIRHALAGGADAVLLVNSDLVLPPDAIARLSAVMEARLSAGIVAPVVRSRVWPDRVLSAGMDFDIATGRMRHRETVDGASWSAVAGVNGCAMLVRREVFERVGLLPEEYFFSFEDLAFCQQALAAGFEVGVAQDAKAYHEGSGTMGASAEKLYFAARNHLRLAQATAARSSLHRLTRQWMVAGFNLAHAMRAREGRLPARLTAVVRGIGDHMRGRYGPG